MKQQITLEQFKELTHKKRENFPYYSKKELGLPTIGQLIQFLGDDLWRMEFDNEDREWTIRADEGIAEAIYESSKELIDALWEGTKHKLNN